MSRFRFVIFDFDGTLADTSEGILATERETFRRMGLPQTSERQMRNGIGLPLAQSLQMGGDIPEERLDEAVKLYRSLFFDYAPAHIRIFDGVKETLSALKDAGIELAIATSRSGSSLSVIMSTHGLDPFFICNTNAEDGYKGKPDPDMVLALLEKTGHTADETLVVGDTTYDILMGSSAGCRTCAVTFGNHTREQLSTASPDWVIDRFSELLKIVP